MAGKADEMLKLGDAEFRKALKDDKFVKTNEIRGGIYNGQGTVETSASEPAKIRNEFTTINNQLRSANPDEQKKGLAQSLVVLNNASDQTSKDKYHEEIGKLEKNQTTEGIKALNTHHRIDELQKLAKVYNLGDTTKKKEVLDLYQTQTKNV